VGDLSLLAVLFTDLVGSTAQRAELGEAAAEELRRVHDRLLAEAVAAHGGRVVKSTGDGVMATFPGAAEAVAAAVAIEQAVDRHNRRIDALAPLSVRVGVSAGDVTVEDEDVFGAPVIEAARLCAVAEGGQVLAAEVVRVLAGDRAAGVCVPVGEVELKGLPGLRAVCEIAWAPVPEPPVPVPGALVPVGGFDFVGRGAELERLGEAWAAAVGGQRGVVLVAGEPGIGKTRLISRFARQVTDQGGVVLYGRAEPELGVPYQPVVEALGGYVRACPQRELAGQMGVLSGELVRLVPQLGERVGGLAGPLPAEPETQRYRLFEAVAELLANASATWPLVVVLDDLQWAGRPTIVLLAHLLQVDLPMRVLVVGCYRDTEVGPEHPLTGLLAEAHRIPGIRLEHLGGLDETDVAALAGQATDQPDAGDRLSDQLHRATDGNPFFVTEILHAIRGNGAIRGDGVDEVDLVALGVPQGAVAMVAHRVARLDPAHQGVLRTAAVIGQRFDLPLLRAVVGDDDLVLGALADAEATGLVGTHELLGGRQFAHALIRDALYASLPPSERTRCHGEVVAALEALPDAGQRLGELAHHATQAIALIGVDAAVRCRRRAADRARQDLAFEEAASHHAAALDLLEVAGRADTGESCDLRIDLTDVLHRAGDLVAGEAALLAAADCAQRLDDPSRLARAALAGPAPGTVILDSSRPDPCLGVVEDALARMDPRDSTARARLLADQATRTGLLVASAAAVHRGHTSAAEAIAMARRLGDDPTLAKVLVGAYMPYSTPDNLGERVGLCDEMITISDRVHDLESANRARTLRAACRIEAGDLDGARADLDDAEHLLDALRQPIHAFYLAWHRAGLALVEGRLDEAERQIVAMSTHLRRSGVGHVLGTTGMMVIQLFWVRGRLAEIGDAVLAALGEAATASARSFRVLEAFVLAETGATDRARRLVDDLIADDVTSWVTRSWMGLTLLWGLATVAADTDHQEAARRLEKALQPYADRIATNGHYAGPPVALVLADLAATQGRTGDADRSYRAAATFCQDRGLTPWSAITSVRWAELLTRTGDPADRPHAADLARHALQIAEQLGMDREAERARSLLAR
jgi:hypothetical protein